MDRIKAESDLGKRLGTLRYLHQLQEAQQRKAAAVAVDVAPGAIAEAPAEGSQGGVEASPALKPDPAPASHAEVAGKVPFELGRFPAVFPPTSGLGFPD